MLDGTTLKRIRLLNHKTQVQVAEAIGVSERFIKGIEANESNPSEETYNDFLNFCYRGTISEKAKRKRAEQQQIQREEAEQEERPIRRRRGRG